MNDVGASIAYAEGRFIQALAALGPADLGTLRRCTGRPLGERVPAFDLFNAIWRPLRRKAGMRKWASYLVATLYPWNPAPGGRGSLGHGIALAGARQGRRLDTHVERLLAARWRTLDLRLGWAVRLLARRGVPVDWPRLLEDLSRWYEPEMPTQARWATDFFKTWKGGTHAY